MPLQLLHSLCTLVLQAPNPDDPLNNFNFSPLNGTLMIVISFDFDLMQAPNPDDPLNKEAAQMMQQSPAQFERLVSQSITRGCAIGGDYFPPARGERSG